MNISDASHLFISESCSNKYEVLTEISDIMKINSSYPFGIGRAWTTLLVVGVFFVVSFAIGYLFDAVFKVDKNSLAVLDLINLVVRIIVGYLFISYFLRLFGTRVFLNENRGNWFSRNGSNILIAIISAAFGGAATAIAEKYIELMKN